MAGIPRATFYRWLDRCEAESPGHFRDFRDAVRQAEGAAVAIILQRRYPERWGRRERVDREAYLRQLAEKVAAANGSDGRGPYRTGRTDPAGGHRGWAAPGAK